MRVSLHVLTFMHCMQTFAKWDVPILKRLRLLVLAYDHHCQYLCLLYILLHFTRILHRFLGFVMTCAMYIHTYVLFHLLS
jgi:hypothetical protein